MQIKEIVLALVLASCDYSADVGQTADAGSHQSDLQAACSQVPVGASKWCNPTWVSFCELSGTVVPTGHGCYVCSRRGGEEPGRAQHGLCCGPQYPGMGATW